MSYQVGVDLGTTYSAAAVCRPGGPVELVPLGQRAHSVPSTVYAGPDGAFLIGEAAERRALSDPGRVVREFKRRIGDPTPVLVGREPVAAEELAARFLDPRAAATWPPREGAVADRVAVTHPAGWGPHKLGSLRGAHGRARAGVGGAAVRAAGRRGGLRRHRAGGAGRDGRGVRPGRRHLRRGRGAQDRRGRLRAARHPGGHRAAGRRGLRRGGVRPRAGRARRGLGGARPVRPGGAGRGGRAAPGVHGGQGGALARHRGADPGAAARGVSRRCGWGAPSSRR